ncbi:MAG TPA: glycerol 3-phosphate dehydrogenase, partial [Saprospiraceae bacterium]|nr:glycerol 3-phosphate dehydrogenase [Saprospiraceae bacterium]
MSETAKPVGVIGAGSFGTAIANLLAHNADVILYTRREDILETIRRTHHNFGVELSPRIQLTNDIQALAERCTLLFPVVPAANFRRMMRHVGPYLRPYHMMIHGTKGFDVHGINLSEGDDVIDLRREHVSTMSEVIRQESAVVRVGCLSGPNLAKEIMEGQPTATVIGSKFDEVFRAGKQV